MGVDLEKVGAQVTGYKPWNYKELSDSTTQLNSDTTEE